MGAIPIDQEETYQSEIRAQNRILTQIEPAGGFKFKRYDGWGTKKQGFWEWESDLSPKEKKQCQFDEGCETRGLKPHSSRQYDQTGRDSRRYEKLV